MPQFSDSSDTDMAACRALLRGGSRSFHLATKLLPRAVSDPAVALYAFCREADDIIDGGSGGLDWLRRRLALVYERASARPAGGPSPLPVLSRASTFRAHCPRRCWRASRGTPRDVATLILRPLRAYAVRVAGSVGAMMAVVHGRTGHGTTCRRGRSRRRDATVEHRSRRG